MNKNNKTSDEVMNISEDNNAVIKISDLPEELIQLVATYLEDKDLINLMLSNKTLYYALIYVYEKTETFSRFLHNYILAFHICNKVDMIEQTDYGKRFKLNSYFKFNNVMDSSESLFLISRVGNIWSWKNVPMQTGSYKRIMCRCQSKFCIEQQYTIEVNMRLTTFLIAIKLDMWENFIKPVPGFRRAFKEIKNELLQDIN